MAVSRRTYTTTLRCTEAKNGCTESSFYESTSRREHDESAQWYAKHPWQCYRHSRPDEVLSAENPETREVLVATEVYYTNYRGERTFNGLFWGSGSEEKARSGSLSGPGFRAICKDFPPGTRLIVTARVEIPESPSVSSQEEKKEGETGDC